MAQNFTNFAFTDSVKAVQSKNGSREMYARIENSRDRYILGPREADFIESRDGFYMATVGENGWPYMQFRGGPAGFLHVLDEMTLGMADYRGNRQYISVGNIHATGKASLFLMDYPTQSRLKLWVEADVLRIEDEPELLARLRPHPEYPAEVERMIRFSVKAFDWNCQQHITPRFTIAEWGDQPAES